MGEDNREKYMRYYCPERRFFKMYCRKRFLEELDVDCGRLLLLSGGSSSNDGNDEMAAPRRSCGRDCGGKRQEAVSNIVAALNTCFLF